jgi:hypothetical protein
MVAPMTADRVIVIGAPRAGKTTYALELGRERGIPVRHTDDLIKGLPWSKVSEVIATQWLETPGPWIIEGVAAVRGLRKWLRANPEGLPFDEIVLLEHPRVDLTSGQAAMAKGCATIWTEVEPEVRARGGILRKVDG